MPPCRTLIVLAILTLLVLEARAQDATPRAPDPGLGLKLRMQETLPPLTAAGSDEEVPVFIEADRIQGTQDREVQAEGNVVLRRRGEVVFADQLHYSLPSSVVTAVGNVRFNRLGDELTGDRGVYNLTTESGSIESPTYYLRQLHARGQAERMIIRDRDRYRAVRATYTNCDVGNDDWFLKVQRLDIDRLTDTGDARNATLYFKHVPILYTPWIDFPLSSQRKTGFLTPTYGSTGKSGLELTVPFYWNLRPDMDYTIAPRVMSRRGVLLSNEFRYLRPTYNGKLQVDYLPEDRIKGGRRSFLSLQHAHDFGYGLSGALNVQRVSDDTYFTDLGATIAATAQTLLPQVAQLRYEGGWWSMLARSLRYQTLQDPLAPITPPYARLPQLTLLASQQNVMGLDMSFDGEFVNFDHPRLLNGRRQIYYPSVSYPFRTPYFYFTPKAGLSYTRYTFPSDPQRAGEIRTLPILSIDSGTSFERNIRLGGRDMIQTLEPRLYYLYIPFRDQTQLPVFDTALKDFNFTSIFSENKFSGGDRINDADQVTVAAISRLLNPTTGAEQVKAALGQRYYFKRQQVTLDSALPTSPVPSNIEPSGASRSDLLAAISGAVTRTVSLDTGLQYGVNNSEIERFNFAVRHQPEPGKVLNLAYRYTRGFLEGVDFSAQWPLSRRWVGLARVNYSLQDHGLVEAFSGLEYNAGCWVVRFVLHRFVTNTQESTNAFFLQLELTGLSRLGTSPLDLLRQGIGGYTERSLRPFPSGPYYPGTEQP